VARLDAFQRKLHNAAERQLAMHAVWCIGPKQGTWIKPGQNAPTHPVIFGTSRDPDEMLRQARKWHWQEIDLICAVWCASAEQAEAIREEIEDMSSDSSLKGRWFNMMPEVAEEAIRLAAFAVGAAILDEETKAERLRQEIARQVKKIDRRR